MTWTQLMQIFVCKDWGSGNRKDQMSPYWICTMPLCRSMFTNLSSFQTVTNGQKILPHLFRFCAQRGTANHGINCEYHGYAGENLSQEHILVLRWHIGLWECVHCGMCEDTSLAIQADKQKSKAWISFTQFWT